MGDALPLCNGDTTVRGSARDTRCRGSGPKCVTLWSIRFSGHGRETGHVVGAPSGEIAEGTEETDQHGATEERRRHGHELATKDTKPTTNRKPFDGRRRRLSVPPFLRVDPCPPYPPWPLAGPIKGLRAGPDYFPTTGTAAPKCCRGFAGTRADNKITEDREMASFSVVNNIASQAAQASLQLTGTGLNKALNRLSSGFRINNSGDDAAGMAVANQYRNDIAMLNQGIRNANDGMSTLQIKDSALANIATVLDRMATLATQASSDAGDADIAKLSSEFNTLTAEIDREAAVAGLTAASTAFSAFVSASSSTISGTIAGVETADLGITQTTFTTVAQAQTALTQVRTAVSTLATVQSSVGTLQNRLQFATTLSSSQVGNTTAAESRIRDANIAEESANMTKFNILTQSGIAALAQANQASSSVLGLLR